MIGVTDFKTTRFRKICIVQPKEDDKRLEDQFKLHFIPTYRLSFEIQLL